jgi:hypothetical protein
MALTNTGYFHFDRTLLRWREDEGNRMCVDRARSVCTVLYERRVEEPCAAFMALVISSLRPQLSRPPSFVSLSSFCQGRMTINGGVA